MSKDSKREWEPIRFNKDPFFISLSIDNYNYGDVTCQLMSTWRAKSGFDFLMVLGLYWRTVIFTFGFWHQTPFVPVLCPTCNKTEYSGHIRTRICPDPIHDPFFKKEETNV